MYFIAKPVVLVEYLPSTDEYIVFREGSEVEFYKGASKEGSEDFQKFIRDCTTSGAYKEITVNVASGIVDGPKEIQCKQIIYCKSLDNNHSNMVKRIEETKKVVSKMFSKGNEIVYVRWNPSVYTLEIAYSKTPIHPVHRVKSLTEADEDTLTFIYKCLGEGGVALKRSYNRPILSGGTSRMTLVTEYFFSDGKIHKDFQGNDSQNLTEEDREFLGVKEDKCYG